MKLVRRNNCTFDPVQTAKTAVRLGLHPRLVELLALRGISSDAQILAYLQPDISDLLDPMSMHGMRQAIERIQEAIDHNQTVIIYGDYDADGICSCAILYQYLSECGMSNLHIYIPRRKEDGYGLSVGTLEALIEEFCPDLILTCDCGISACEEVTLCIDLGVDVVITDHHEAGVNLPDCVIVNPKQPACNYPQKILCGAGVALKLVQAHGGEAALMRFVDLAAVATIADIVPLTGENRIIVSIGLARLNSPECNMGLRMLIDNAKARPVTAGEIAFKLAPRINVAGRMGDASRAFELLTTDDAMRANQLLSSINDDNLRRKQLSEEQYTEAIADLEHEDLPNSRAIVLSHPSWEKGVTGILAARLASEFRRPAFVLVENGDEYKGSARSIDDINLYELLSYCSDLLTEFGGHRQAAGFALQISNREAFRRRVEEYLSKVDIESWLPVVEYDLQLDASEIDLDLARALEMLEPTGNCSPKPLILLGANSLRLETLKGVHTQAWLPEGLSLLNFFCRDNAPLAGDGPKRMVVEIQHNPTYGKVVKGIVKAIDSQPWFDDDSLQTAVIGYNTYIGSANPVFESFDDQRLGQVIGTDFFGTLVICSTRETFERVRSMALPNVVTNDFAFFAGQNNYTRSILAPQLQQVNLNYYNRIVLADAPMTSELVAYLNPRELSDRVLVTDRQPALDALCGLEVTREALLTAYEVVSRHQNKLFRNVLDAAEQMSSAGNSSAPQLMLALAIFAELGLLSVQPSVGYLFAINRTRTDLASSVIFNTFARLCAGR